MKLKQQQQQQLRTEFPACPTGGYDPCAFTATALGSIPGQGTEIPQADELSQNTPEREIYVYIHTQTHTCVHIMCIYNIHLRLKNKTDTVPQQVVVLSPGKMNNTVSFLQRNHRTLPVPLHQQYV